MPAIDKDGHPRLAEYRDKRVAAQTEDHPMEWLLIKKVDAVYRAGRSEHDVRLQGCRVPQG